LLLNALWAGNIDRQLWVLSSKRGLLHGESLTEEAYHRLVKAIVLELDSDCKIIKKTLLPVTQIRNFRKEWGDRHPHPSNKI